MIPLSILIENKAEMFNNSRGEDEMEVHLPIKPTVPGEQGLVTVNIRLMTQIMSKRQSVDIMILPEGSMVHRHTSVMLDLKSRANEYEYMNIIVDEVRLIAFNISVVF